MKYPVSTFVLIVVVQFCPVFAQKGPCTEESIRAASKAGPPVRTDDSYLFNPMLPKPVIGDEERNKANQSLGPSMANRKNMSMVPPEIDRIVVATSGDMAYGYGTSHMSYDETDSGKHVDTTLAFLSVWKADGGSCKLAATMIQPERQP